MFRPFAFAVLAAVSALLFTACGDAPKPADPGGTNAKKDAPAAKDASATKNADKKHVIAVIAKNTSHEFWKQIEAGSISAAKDKNYEIAFKAGEPGDDPNAQLALALRMMTEGVEAVVLAPIQGKLLAQAVDKAFELKIPMVIIDSPVDADFNKYAAFVATHNKGGGAQCAERLAAALNGKGDVLLLRDEPGNANTMEREEGFTETLAKKFPDIKIVAEKHAGPTPESALKNASALLAASPRFDGVFACNELGTTAMLHALRERGLAGKIKFVGFDTTRELTEAVEKGEIEALAAQDPFRIGAEGVSQAILAIEKKPNTNIVIDAVMKDKAAVDLEEKIRKQEEEERVREANNKRIEEENKRQVEEQRKKIEAEQKANETK